MSLPVAVETSLSIFGRCMEIRLSQVNKSLHMYTARSQLVETNHEQNSRKEPADERSTKPHYESGNAEAGVSHVNLTVRGLWSTSSILIMWINRKWDEVFEVSYVLVLRPETGRMLSIG